MSGGMDMDVGAKHHVASGLGFVRGPFGSGKWERRFEKRAEMHPDAPSGSCNGEPPMRGRDSHPSSVPATDPMQRRQHEQAVLAISGHWRAAPAWG